MGVREARDALSVVPAAACMLGELSRGGERARRVMRYFTSSFFSEAKGRVLLFLYIRMYGQTDRWTSCPK